MCNPYYIDTAIDQDAKSSPAEPSPTEALPIWLEDRLRRFFRDVRDEPLPAGFTRLLRQLKDEDHRLER